MTPDDAPPPLSIVLLHGHGGHPVAYEDIATELSATLSCPVVVPAGPVEVEGGRAWWDAPDEGPGAAARAIVAEAVGSAGGTVMVVGFSQGAAMAAAVAGLASIAGVVMVAGFAPEPRPDEPVTAPVLCLYADDDDVVDPFMSQVAARWMGRRGAEVDTVAVEGGHQWTATITAEVADWIRSVCAGTA